MFKTAPSWSGFTILVSFLLIFTGCEGPGPDIEGQEESIAVQLTAHDDMDSSSDPTFEIDIKRDVFGTLDEYPENPEEPNELDEASIYPEKSSPKPFYDTLGKATFSYIFYCPNCPPDAYETYIIDSYTVEYIPLRSLDTEGEYFLPPKLTSLENRSLFYQVILSKDFKIEERNIILIQVDTKNEFQEKSNFQDTPLTGASYDVRVNFHGRNHAGEPFSTISELLITFGNYDNCEP